MSPSTPAAKAAPRSSSTGYDENGISSSSWSSEQQPTSSSSSLGGTTTTNTNTSRTPSSLEEKAEQVSQLFSTTVTALAADVTALKHLTTWKDILQQNTTGDSDSNNSNNNNNGAEERREEFLESLVKLDGIVSLMEKKVVTLRQVVADENEALDKLNLLRDESTEQNAKLRALVQRCREMKQQQQRTTATPPPRPSNSISSSSSPQPTTTTNITKNTQNKKTTNFPNALRDKENAATTMINNTSSTDETNSHAIIDVDWVYLDPVTPEELERVPRTTKGRVQVAVLNEALANIEQCFHQKTVAEQRKHQQLVDARRATLSHNSYDGDEDVLDDEEVLRNMIVYEQELRKSCSFFTFGESTARTVLSVLKELKRIKQVPNKKKGVFTYKLCLD